MDTNIELIKWNHRADKLSNDIKEYQDNLDENFLLTEDELTISNIMDTYVNLKTKLNDIECWMEVDDFLENGPGFPIDNGH